MAVDRKRVSARFKTVTLVACDGVESFFERLDFCVSLIWLVVEIIESSSQERGIFGRKCGEM